MHCISYHTRQSTGEPFLTWSKNVFLFLRVGSRRAPSRKSQRNMVVFRRRIGLFFFLRAFKPRSFCWNCKVLHLHFFRVTQLVARSSFPCRSGRAQKEFVAGCSFDMFQCVCEAAHVVSTSFGTASDVFWCCWVFCFDICSSMGLITVARPRDQHF